LTRRLFEEYFYHRKTLKELAKEYGHSRAWVQERIHQYGPSVRGRYPRPVVLVIDATFFGKRRDKFGVLVAKDPHRSEMIAYRFITSETLEEYLLLRKSIESKGYEIKAVVTDGKPGLFGLFEGIPLQMCHFHQQAILTRYLTRSPRMKASMDLKRIGGYLGKITQRRFTLLLNAWLNRHQSFFDEKVPDDSKRGWHYKHKRLRSAYHSLRRHLPWLYTYRRYPELQIPNTTNTLDGGLFSPLKDLLKVHRGISRDLKTKLIIDYLENGPK
jgi:hypothetical protein